MSQRCWAEGGWGGLRSEKGGWKIQRGNQTKDSRQSRAATEAEEAWSSADDVGKRGGGRGQERINRRLQSLSRIRV